MNLEDALLSELRQQNKISPEAAASPAASERSAPVLGAAAAVKSVSLRKTLLSELRRQNEIAQAQIKRYEDDASAEAFMMSTVSGALSGAARSACQTRMQAANAKKDQLLRENAWISEMLSKYR